jgi:hypothetical protein
MPAQISAFTNANAKRSLKLFIMTFPPVDHLFYSALKGVHPEVERCKTAQRKQKCEKNSSIHMNLSLYINERVGVERKIDPGDNKNQKESRDEGKRGVHRAQDCPPLRIFNRCP